MTMRVISTGIQKTLDILVRDDVVINHTFSEGLAFGVSTGIN